MNIIFNNADLLSVILVFSRNDEYSFIGTVNKSCNNLCDAESTKSASCFETVSRLKDSGIQYHDRCPVNNHVMQCGSVDVMRHALHTGIVDNSNGVLEHAIRSNDTQLNHSIRERVWRDKDWPGMLGSRRRGGFARTGANVLFGRRA